MATAGGLATALRWERRLHTSRLLRIYQFAPDWAAGRIEAFPPWVERLTGDVERRPEDPGIDEVPVVGFSVGSMLAVSAAARWAGSTVARQPGKLSLLTLGRWGTAFRLSSPVDWGSFALVDPVSLCVGNGGVSRRGDALVSLAAPNPLATGSDPRRLHHRLHGRRPAASSS